MRFLLIFFLIFLVACEKQLRSEKEEFVTPFEESEGRETATYEEAIEFYMALAREFPEINIQTIGETDSGLPLHVVTFNSDADFNFNKLVEQKTIILINNGIHPGESDGIDATMLFFRDLAQEVIAPPGNCVIVTIPVYNVGGARNRGGPTRVNQNGPAEYGFRGNARNYDLNRDFIKCDTKNTRTFTEIFHLVQPDVFIDTHVSNGADYQYVLSHIFTQHNKLGGKAGTFLEEVMIPSLQRAMEEQDLPVTPYVYLYNTPPDNGFTQFMDHPRYSTGYAALWNTLGLMIESHMLKPYQQRVEATYSFLEQIVTFAEREHSNIQDARNKSQKLEFYPTRWELDSTRASTLSFKGYKADTLISNITGLDRLKYDRERPFTKEISFYNQYRVSDSIKVPNAYVIRKEWQKIIDLLTLNHITYTQFQTDTILEVESYTINSYHTRNAPYEGHYLHYDTQVTQLRESQAFFAGDYLVPTDQPGIRYLLETLEPEAVDSFFNWNFFDSVLQLKEGFSPYVFEDLAAELLEANPVLRDSFEARKNRDPAFEQNGNAQLQWIYENSEYYESAYMKYPVYRYLGEINLD